MSAAVDMLAAGHRAMSVQMMNARSDLQRRSCGDYIIQLRPKPGVDGVRALRCALKVLGRRFGLRAVRIETCENCRPKEKNDATR